MAHPFSGYVIDIAILRGASKPRSNDARLSRGHDGGFTVTFRDVPEAITEGDAGMKR